MLKKFLMTLCFGLFCVTNVFADNDYESKFVNDIVKNISFLEKQSESLWSGYHFTKRPIMVYFVESQNLYAFHNYQPKTTWHIYTLGLPVYVHKWEKRYNESYEYYYHHVADNDFLDKTTDIYYFTSYLDPPKLINLKRIIEGQDCDVYIVYSPDSDISPKELIAKQFKIDSKHAKDGNPIKSLVAQLPPHPTYDALNNAENIALMSLEIKILQAANKPEEAQTALKYFAAVNHYRLSKLSKDSLNYEKITDLVQGIPSYISWNSNFDNTEYTKFLANYSVADQAIDDASLSATPNALKMIQELGLEFNSITDPIVGQKLNDIMPLWQQSRLKSVDNTLAELLYQNYFMTDENLNDLVASVKNIYGYDDILAKITKVLDPFLAKVKQYDEFQGTEVVIEFPDSKMKVDPGNQFFKINNHQKFYSAYSKIEDDSKDCLSISKASGANKLLPNASPLFVSSSYDPETEDRSTIVRIKLSSDSLVSYRTEDQKRVYGDVFPVYQNIPLGTFLTSGNLAAISSKLTDVKIITPDGDLIVNIWQYLDPIKLENDGGVLKVVVEE